MLVTKNAAELCVLLIRELYGQLPSRVFAVLLSKGRSSIGYLAHNSSLNPRQVRHGLAVLIQENLVFWHTNTETAATNYEANADAAYNLVRTGKILDIIHRNYGEDAKTLAHKIMLSGHMTVCELVEIYKASQNNPENSIKGHFHGNGDLTSDPFDLEMAEVKNVDVEAEARELLARLIAHGILEPVSDRMLQIDEDIRQEVEQELMRDYPSGLRGAKQKQEFDEKVSATLKSIHEERQALRKQLESDYLNSGSKRRKFAHGGMQNGFTAMNHDDNILGPDVVIRVNYEKCLVELRNRKLCQYAEDTVGYVTAQVYGAMLSALTKKIPSCHPQGQDLEDAFNGPTVSTMEIFEHLKPSLDVFAGIGKCGPDMINTNSAEKIQRNAPGAEENQDQEGNSSDEDEDGDHVMGLSNGSNLNGAAEYETQMRPGSPRDTKVKFTDKAPTKAEQMLQMRQHLLLLAETSQQFVRHCGTLNHGLWTVDFELLMRKLRLQEIDTLVEESFGRQGLRLVRILREKGKTDDKTIPRLALMKKGDVLTKMAEMELAGFLDVQEVPRDTNRTAQRTIFLWFFDKERTLVRLLDNTYKAIVRHVQRLEIEKQKKKNVLAVVERKDVQGMEEEKLRGDAYNEYREFLDIQRNLLGQIDRLDDLVAVFRDY